MSFTETALRGVYDMTKIERQFRRKHKYQTFLIYPSRTVLRAAVPFTWCQRAPKEHIHNLLPVGSAGSTCAWSDEHVQAAPL